MSKRVPLSELSPLMTEALQNGGEVTLTITGASMLPLLRHRKDKVCLAKPKEKQLKKFDIPLYIRPDGKYVLHRIVEVKQSGFVVIGDNQCIKEYPVMPSQVVGVVKGFWRNGKYTSCADFGYQVYSRFWVSLYPLRWFYLKGKRLLSKGVRLFIHRNGDNHDEG